MSQRLEVHLYDANNATPIGWLRGAIGVRCERTLNEPDRISFLLRRDDPQQEEMQVGRFVRVYSVPDGSLLATGRLFQAPRRERNRVAVEAVGALAELGRARFPESYLLQGDLSDDPDAWICAYDVRTVRATTTSASGTPGDEIVTFSGTGTGNTAGAFSNTEAIDRADPAAGREDLGAVVLDHDGTEYPTTGVYETPFFDFQTAPSAWDRLRFDGIGWADRIGVRVATFDALSDARSFTGTPTYSIDRAGVGIDLSGLPTRRYLAAEFTLQRLHPQQSAALHWVEVVARRGVPGIVGATLPSVAFGLLDVGGRSLRAALEQLCARYLLEYRLSPAGILEVQPLPEPGAVGPTWGVDRRDRYTLTEGKHFRWVEERSDPIELQNYTVVADPTTGLQTVVQDAAGVAADGYRQRFHAVPGLTLSALKTVADRRLSRHVAPTGRWRLELYRTPDQTVDFAPGDLIRLLSAAHGDESGPFDRAVRIVREVREETENGLRLLLEVEQIAPRLEQLLSRPEPASVAETVAGGCWWTPIVSDSTPVAVGVPLPFLPTRAEAAVVEVEADPTGTPSYGTAHSGAVSVEITQILLGRDHLQITLQRTAGTVAYRARVLWTAWGRLPRL